MSINPKDARPGEYYLATYKGERTVWERQHSAVALKWESFKYVADDDDLSDLVHLVPSRPVTRNDLPSALRMESVCGPLESDDVTWRDALDMVVSHMNADGGIPEGTDWRSMWVQAVRERDEARDALDRAQSDWRTATRTGMEMEDRAEKAERQRDEWQERAENAEFWWSRWKDAAQAPQVSWEDIEKVVGGVFDRAGRGRWPGRGPITGAVWSLLHPTDPAVLVIRESEIAAVEAERAKDEAWYADGALVAWIGESAEEVRGQHATARRNFIHREAVARAIEAEATDPVEAKAEELYAVMCPEAEGYLPWEESGVEVKDAARELARHVLDREATS